MTDVLRHSRLVRLTHFLFAGSGLLLVFSGFGCMPSYRRYNIAKLPGLAWSADFEIQLILHYLAAAVFVATGVFHLVYHLRRREWAVWPKRGDGRESLQIVAAMLRGRPEPPHGKFLAEQRLAYAAIAAVAGILAVTGLLKAFKNTGPIVLDPGFLQMATLVHTFTTAAFLLLVALHLAAFLLPANWPLLPSMLTGTVARAYAERRHPHWRLPAPPVARGDGEMPAAPHPRLLDISTLPRPDNE